MGNSQTPLQISLSKEITRKEFLLYIVLVFLLLTRIEPLLRMLGKSSRSTSITWTDGNETYGSTKRGSGL
jgi:hypothetical protein